MARSIFWMALGSLIFTAGISWGQATPPSWPTPNPVRPETSPSTSNPPVYQNNSLGNQNPAARANPPADSRYTTAQLGNSAGAADNRYPQMNPPVQPDQPVVPQNPALQHRLPMQQGQPTQPVQQPQAVAPPPPQFLLTAVEQGEVNRVLRAWEEKSKKITSFDSKFVRWEYDLTMAKPAPGTQPAPVAKEQGYLKYATPDKGIYRITYTDMNGKWEPTPPERIQHWLCDGNSVFEYQYSSNPDKPGQVIEHPLPPEMKGKAIADGPLPFLFGADANKLNRRYFFRLLEAPNPQKEVWLEAYPKFQQDRANFELARLVLNLPDMTPKALQLILPGSKNYHSYEFFEMVVNNPLIIFRGNPFNVYIPRGWQRVIEPAPAQNVPSMQPLQAGRPAGQPH